MAAGRRKKPSNALFSWAWQACRARDARGRSVAGAALASALLLLPLLPLVACKPVTVADAEAKGDVDWLASQGTPEAVSALGRLADEDSKAQRALEARAGKDVNVYIAAWQGTLRNASWGPTMIRAGLADPTRADMAASALPRRDQRLIPFTADLESTVERLSAGHGGGVIAGLLATVGPAAHAAVERRLLDPKTRGAMCEGIGMPDASGDAKSVLLAVPAEARDHATCVADVMAMAETEDVVLTWLATGAEPGLLSVMAKGQLPCPRVAAVWRDALASRPAGAHAALSVPLGQSIHRCGRALDPVLADALVRVPRARACIMQAVDPYGAEVSELGLTCRAIRQGLLAKESPRIRERASDALSHGCTYVR